MIFLKKTMTCEPTPPCAYPPIHQALNHEVLSFLMANSAVYALAARQSLPREPQFLEEVEMRELRTHPDLGIVLYNLAQEIPGIFHGYVLGYNVLISARGVIFALAMSMNFLAFRANPPAQTVASSEVYSSSIGLSREWVTCSPFGNSESTARLKLTAEKALANVEKLSDDANKNGPQ